MPRGRRRRHQHAAVRQHRRTSPCATTCRLAQRVSRCRRRRCSCGPRGIRRRSSALCELRCCGVADNLPVSRRFACCARWPSPRRVHGGSAARSSWPSAPPRSSSRPPGCMRSSASIVAQRSREIGVRLALGASPWGTLQMVVRQSLAWVVAGLLAGLAAALAAGRFIRPLLFETSPYDAHGVCGHGRAAFARRGCRQPRAGNPRQPRRSERRASGGMRGDTSADRRPSPVAARQSPGIVMT